MEVETEKATTPAKRKRIKSYKARGEASLRTSHCSRLTRLLDELIKQRNWKEASGVLSLLLQGTARETFPKENRNKYLATMELLKKIENDHIKVTSTKHVYEIWIRKNGAMKKGPAKDKFSTQLEFILFCLTHRSLDDANQAMTSLMQEAEYGSDPVLNMVAGLVYYELWYSCIPDDMKLKSSDIFGASMLQELSGPGSFNPVESTCCNSFDEQDVESPAQDGSASSIGNNKELRAEALGVIQREPSNQVFRPQGFYIAESSDTNGTKEFNHDETLKDTTIFKFHGLDLNVLPLRLPELNENFGNSIAMYMRMLNDHYSKAVKHLQVALYSTPPVLASLLPLVQLLLLGDQVPEAIKELENICQTSNLVLPLRVKAVLLECFESKNFVMLSSCYENILEKDPTCTRSLTKLIAMYKNGDYGLVPLLEMIALHLDATYAPSSIWAEFASCFLKLSHLEEDQLSVCGNADHNVRETMYPSPMRMFPARFIHGNSKKSWELRCKWWSYRYFSKNNHASEIKQGDWELLMSKAACASHMYGPEFWYVVRVCSCLEKEEMRDELLLLKLHMRNSVNVLDQLKFDEIVLEDDSCSSN
ncbi:hypothetical protein ACHQM5_017660 [Ranunculus cassubicifolius]